MSFKEPKVLAAGVEKGAFERLAPVLQRDALRVDWVPTPEAGVTLAAAQRYDVVILDSDPTERSLERIVGEIRRGQSPSRNAAIMVLAKPDRVDAVRALKSRGVNRVMLVSDPPHIICDQMASLLEVAPRVSARVPMNLMTSLGDHGREMFCQTVNLSESGMLVRMESGPPPGSSVLFRLHLSDQSGSVIGRGEMIRRASKYKGGFDGIGVRFLSFAEDGEARLRRFLEDRRMREASARLEAAGRAEAEDAADGVVVEIAPEFDPLQDPDLAAFFDSESSLNDR